MRIAAAVACGLACVVAGEASAGATPGRPGDEIDPPPHELARARVDLANECFGVVSRAGLVSVSGADAYRAGGARPAAFYLKPTGLGTYMLRDEQGALLAAADDSRVVRASEPGPLAEWRVRRAAARRFRLRSTSTGGRLALAAGSGELVLAPRGDGASFGFLAAEGCSRFPEATVGARGRPRERGRRGEVFGFADLHLHVTAELRAGGRVIHGTAFDRFGISHALGGDEEDHGPEGTLDVTGNLLRTGVPVGTHDTHGWPTFSGWPVHDTYTHQQAYYVWLKRAWRAGLRIVVAQAIEDEPLCRLEPLRSHPCDEMHTLELAVQRLRELERYVDAQSGGHGRGWLRLVRDPTRARRVVGRGKVAMVIGFESSNPLGCAEVQGEPQCARADVDRGLDRLHRLGVRSLFPVHWPDNAFAGAALQSGANGIFIGSMQLLQTGHPFSTEPCGEADEADGRCNAAGLRPLGRYLIRQMMRRHMLIEADHLSQKAREAVLDIAEKRRYPLVSSHTGTGGEWTPEQLARLRATGGIATATPEPAPELVEKLLRLRRARRLGLALGSDTGGFNALPGPRVDAAAHPLRYPYESFDGGVTFKRQRTGERVYDLNTDGVAHYGLFPDLLADAEAQPRGERALTPLFRSAEAYLRTWRLAERRP